MREKGFYPILILSSVGFVVSLAAGLADRISWLQAACASVSSGCSDTAEFSILGAPVWLWGAGFYIVVGVASWFARSWVSLIVAGALGVELTLIHILYSSNIPCIFCLVNAGVVFALVSFSFERARLWQMVSIALFFVLVSGSVIPRQDKTLAYVRENGEQLPVAEVAGKVITAEMLEQPLVSRIYDMERNLYKLKRERLEQMIIETILEKEAAERGISIQELVDGVVLSERVSVSEAEIEEYYRANHARLSNWQGSEEELKNRLRAMIQQEKTYRKVMEYGKSLHSKYGVVVRLDEPPFPRTNVSISDEPALGPPGAPVTVVEFSDYLCPACRSVHEVTRQIREIYEGRIRWVFKDYPLAKHKWANEAAEAARCADEQERFWEYQDMLFSSDEELHPERLVQYAKELGLDEKSFRDCLQSGRYRDKVAKSYEEGRMTGIEATPSFVVNSRLIRGGLSLDRFKEIIDGELKKAGGEG